MMYAAKHVNTSYQQPTAIRLDAFSIQPNLFFFSVLMTHSWSLQPLGGWSRLLQDGELHSIVPFSPIAFLSFQLQRFCVVLQQFSSFASSLLCKMWMNSFKFDENEGLYIFINAQKRFSNLSLESHIESSFRLKRILSGVITDYAVQSVRMCESV